MQNTVYKWHPGNYLSLSMNEELKHHEKAPLLRVCGILGGGGGGEVCGKMRSAAFYIGEPWP